MLPCGKDEGSLPQPIAPWNLAAAPVTQGIAERGPRRIDAAAYATRDLDWTLYDFGHFLNELQTGKIR